jgi:5-methylcytosine-specific restriction enzyme subunit McrC
LDAIELTEYKPSNPLQLLEVDADHIRSDLPGIDLAGPFHDGSYVLNPNQYVGVAILPSQRRLQINPKVGVGSLLHMLGVTARLESELRKKLADFESLNDVVEAIALFFTTLVEERMKRGLHRDYVERDENLSALRGRIHFPEDVRHNLILRHRLYCRFAEFTWDIPHNQVIRQVARLLTRWPFSGPTRRRVSQLNADLSEISRTVVSLPELDLFRYHRLNADYQPIHSLCRLILQGASVSEKAGIHAFPTFLVNMNTLFEQFVREALTSRMRRNYTFPNRRQSHLGVDKKVPIEPDMVLNAYGVPSLVADCKYKRLKEGEFKNHDIYQVLSYAVAFNVQRGILIYPRHEQVDVEQIVVRNSSIQIQTLALDLNLSPSMLEAECDRVATEFFSWAHDQPNREAA